MEESPSEVSPTRVFGSALRRAALPLAALAACVLALLLLRGPSRKLDYHAIVAVLRAMPPDLIWPSVLLTALSYLALVGRDRCAWAYVGIEVPRSALLLGSFCASALGNAVGFGALSGHAVRDRIYSSVDVRPEKVARFTLFADIGFGFGFFAFAALCAICAGHTLGRILPLRMTTIHATGAVALLAIAALLARIRMRAPLEIGRLSLAMPTLGVASLELLLTIVDVGAASAVLWILLPSGRIGFFSFSVIFSAAMALGVISRIPAGLGAFEAVIFLALGDVAPPDEVAAALLIYRGVYFALPLLLAAASLAFFELRLPSRGPAATAGERVLAQARFLAPSFLSVVTFSVGVMLVISGATPVVDWRLAALQRILPLWAVEISHLIATLAGVFLLFVARGLYHRLDGAWWLALIIALANVVFSLAKGLAFGETTAMIFLIFLLLATRRQFTRPAAFLGEPFTAGWIAAITVVIMAAIGILFFAFRDVGYHREIWWQVEFDAQASRALRALLAASVLALGISLWQLLRGAPGRVKPPSPEQLSKAARIIQEQDRSAAMLALMGDKSLLFSSSGKSFLMYAKRGRSWVALLDPIGPQREWLELVWQFVELAATHDGRAAIYQIRPESLPIYLDAGLRVIKVGEEACIYLEQFTLMGPERYGLRQAIKRAERDGLTFELFSPGQLCAPYAVLERISEAWLSSHHASERRFSVASFEPHFVAAQSVMLSLQHGRPLAFVTFMTTKPRTEATIGLMRYIPEAPPFTMEFMLTELALDLKARGFGMLSLGMAPLAGLVRTSLSSRSHRLAGLLWEHGGSIYNFQGLRAFKNKFHPVWEPRYLAASGAIGPYITLADVAALASGFLKGSHQ
ncbi:MAG: bifunctional lysylphosphatidylglycerol flippase/synthetase MprF [Candidatus Binataceae bacterium]